MFNFLCECLLFNRDRDQRTVSHVLQKDDLWNRWVTKLSFVRSKNFMNKLRAFRYNFRVCVEPMNQSLIFMMITLNLTRSLFGMFWIVCLVLCIKVRND